MIWNPLRRNEDGPRHVGDTIHSLRIKLMLGGPMFLLFSIIETFWLLTGRFGGIVYLILLVPVNFVLIWLACTAFENGFGNTAKAIGDVILGAGNIAPEPGFSSEEALIMQGKLVEAEDALHDRWLRNFDLHEAGLRLAELRVKMGMIDEAEEVYIELRRRQLPPKVAEVVANRLIDLYQRLRRTDRLKVELARYSAEHKGTSAGESAARRLREIREQEEERKAEDGED